MEANNNPLGYRSIKLLLRTMAIPAVIANITNALYNIVDQIFIGNGVGYLGNAATTVSFPITTICLSIGVMIGVGTAANFNLSLGAKNKLKAEKVVGSSLVFVFFVGILLCMFIRTFLEKLLMIFGATEEILPYALEYAGITSLGIPFYLITLGTNPLIRADRSPKYAMITMLIGSVLNAILDAILIFGFNLGIAGAAWATVFSQVITAIIVLHYYKKFKSIKIKKENFKFNISIIREICKLGLASFIFQLSTTFVQVVSNNVLNLYGDSSMYGSDISIAVAGIVSKINVIFTALVLGIVQGSQPIVSFNYGAKNYDRVKETLFMVLKYTIVIASVTFIIFQLFPKQIISIFGEGNKLYYDFGVYYMRIFFSVVFLNGIMISSSTFFPSIGKAYKGGVISITKQIIILIPLLVLLPKFFGIYGIVYAIPIADVLTFIVATLMIKYEMKLITKESSLR